LLLPALFAGASPNTLAAARTRLQNQFAADYQNMEPQTRDTWIDAILTLERAAGLDETDEMTIYSIIASDAELASADLEAFAGFFDRRYREHDYSGGPAQGQAFLRTPGLFWAGRPAALAARVRACAGPQSGRLKLADMDPGVRAAVRDAFVARANEIMKQGGCELADCRADCAGNGGSGSQAQAG